MDLNAAEVVKKYRIECGLNQAQMAKVFKTTQGTISEIENGGSISKRLAKKFATMLEHSLEFFVG